MSGKDFEPSEDDLRDFKILLVANREESYVDAMPPGERQLQLCQEAWVELKSLRTLNSPSFDAEENRQLLIIQMISISLQLACPRTSNGRGERPFGKVDEQRSPSF
jgi:hypothetical protein